MAGELLDELEHERLKDDMRIERVYSLDGGAMEHAYDNAGFLDRITEGMVREVWFKALDLGCVPRGLPQVEKHEESLFGRESLKIIVSMRCAPGSDAKKIVS